MHIDLGCVSLLTDTQHHSAALSAFLLMIFISMELNITQKEHPPTPLPLTDDVVQPEGEGLKMDWVT